MESCASGGRAGSSAWWSPFFHPLGGWSPSYPETTGYLIPSLHDGAVLAPEHSRRVRDVACHLVRWLLDLQLDNGAFPGGQLVAPGRYRTSAADYLRRRTHPPRASVFNSAQILHGLLRHAREAEEPDVSRAIRRCGEYLAGSVRGDGSWSADAYAGDLSPSYFTFASSRLLEAWRHTGEDRLRDAAVRSLERVADQQDPDSGFIRGAGFGGRDHAVMHTLAYTLQGLLESADLLGAEGDPFAEVASLALERLFRLAEVRKRLPGIVGPGWSRDMSFRCPTGEAQIAICLLLLHDREGDPRLLNGACRLYSAVTRSQGRGGRVPGSVPVWGPYMRLRWPTWAGKFLLDATCRIHAALKHEWART